MPRTHRLKGFPAFFLIWFGQVISTLGSGLTGFGIGVWVYQQTGAVTSYALIGFFATAPTVVTALLVGPLVDRFDRRKLLLLADGMAALCTLALASLTLLGHLATWHIYLLVAISSAFSSVHWPAMSAATTMLVPKGSLARAAAMTQIGLGASQVASPAVAGALFGSIGLKGIFLIDLATFVFAAAALSVCSIPHPTASPESDGKERPFVSQVLMGWHFIRAHRGLIALLLVLAAANFSNGILMALITPLVLSFSSAEVLGRVLSVASSGLLFGSIVVSIWGGPRQRIRAILTALFAQGLILFLGGLHPSAGLIASAGFLYLATGPLIYACSQSIWQVKVAPEMQGRVFSIRRFIALSTTPLAALSAGPLADRLFEPMMLPGGLLATSVGRVIGTGPGRGIGLLMILLGCLSCTIVFIGRRYAPLQQVEIELPDAIPDTALAIEEDPEASRSEHGINH